MKVFVSNCFQNLHTNKALQMSTTECIEKYCFILFHNFLSCNNTSHWETITHAFGQCDNIRLETCPSVSPEFFTDSTETSLDFIWDDNTTIISNKFSNSWSITLWNRVDSSNTLNGFKDHSCDFAMNSVWLESLLCIFKQQLSSF